MRLHYSWIIFGLLLASPSAFAQDCRVIFNPGYSEEVKALIGSKFTLVDERTEEETRTVPFRIDVLEDHDADPETLTLRLQWMGTTIREERRFSGDFAENFARTEGWLKNLPSCESLYK